MNSRDSHATDTTRDDGPKVIATDAALALIGRLVARHGPVLFHQSGGCCDGSVPMCFAQGDFLIGDGDRLLGHIGGMPFYISAVQLEAWSHSRIGIQIVIDAVPGRAGMFSLEGAEGMRWVSDSRSCPKP